MERPRNRGSIKGTLHFSGVDSYVNIGDVSAFRQGLECCMLSVWIKGDSVEAVAPTRPLGTGQPQAAAAESEGGEGVERPGRMCLVGMLHESRKVYSVFFEDGRAFFELCDVDGRRLCCETTALMLERTWHRLTWEVVSASQNKTRAFLDSQEVKLRVTVAEGPSEFAGMGTGSRKSFFPSDTLVGAFPDSTSETKVAHCFKGWVKNLCLFVDNKLTYRWPMDSGCRSTIPETITHSPLCTGSTWKCVWDKSEEPPTSLCFSGKEQLALAGPEGLGRGPWRVSVWVKTLLEHEMCLLRMEDPRGAAEGLAEVTLNAPNKNDCTLRVSRGCEEHTTVATADLCDGEWHELAVGILGEEQGTEMEVCIDATRVTRPVRAVDSAPCTPCGTPSAAAANAEAAAAAAREVEAAGCAGLFVEAGVNLTIPKGYQGFARHLAVSSNGKIVSELLLDEACGDVCRNAVARAADGEEPGGGSASAAVGAAGAPPATEEGPPRACDGLLSSVDVWHPTDPPPFVLFLRRASYVVAAETQLSALDDFSVSLFIKSTPPPVRCRLMSCCLDDKGSFCVLELGGSADKAYFTVCTPAGPAEDGGDGGLNVTCLGGDTTVCDNAWHKVTWRYSSVAKERRTLEVDNVQVGVSVVEADAAMLRHNAAATGQAATRFNVARVVDGGRLVFEALPPETPEVAEFMTLEGEEQSWDEGTCGGAAYDPPVSVPRTLVIGGSALSCYLMNIIITETVRTIDTSLSAPRPSVSSAAGGSSDAAAAAVAAAATAREEASAVERTVANLPLTEGFGTSVTVLPSGQKAQCHNVWWKPTGTAKCALYFDGSSTFIDFGNPSPAFSPDHFESFSLALWLKCGNINQRQTLWSASDARNPELESSASLTLNKVRPGSLTMRVSDSFGRSLVAHASLNIFDVVWHNVKWEVVSAEEGLINLFVDSKKIDTVVESEAPRSFQLGRNFQMCIGATPMTIPVDYYDGAIRFVTLRQPYNGPLLGCWPLSEGRGSVAGDKTGTFLGDCFNYSWMYTATPSLTLQLCGAKATFSTYVDSGLVYSCGFWLHFTGEGPATLFTVKAGTNMFWHVEVNTVPEECETEREKNVGLLTVRVANSSIVMVVDCGASLSSGEWQRLDFELHESDTDVSVTVSLNYEPQPATYFVKEERIDAPAQRGCTLCIGDPASSLEACLRCVTAQNRDGTPLVNVPLSHNLVDSLRKNRGTCSVANYGWILSALPPSTPYFNGVSTYANLGTVREFGALMGKPWGVHLRIRCSEGGADAADSRRYSERHGGDGGSGGGGGRGGGGQDRLRSLAGSLASSVQGGRPASAGRSRRMTGVYHTQTLLSCVDVKKRFVLELHPRQGDAVKPWYLRMVVADCAGRQREVLFVVPQLADLRWHSLCLRVVAAPETEAVLLVDGEEVTQWYGVCGAPSHFTQWEAPLYLGAQLSSEGLVQHFCGSLTDVALVHAPVRPEDAGKPQRYRVEDEVCAAKWILRTGYGNEAPDSNASSGKPYHGSLVSCSWQFDVAHCGDGAGRDASPSAKPSAAAATLRDVAREAKVTVSHWCEDPRGTLLRGRHGGVSLTRFVDGDGWGSGEPPPQWIQFDLLRNVQLHGLDLLTRCDQLVGGTAPSERRPFSTHEVWLGGGEEPLVKAGDVRVVDCDFTWTTWRVAHPFPAVRTIKILTTCSEFRVGWRSLRVLVPDTYKHRLRMVSTTQGSLPIERPLRINDEESIRQLFKRYDVMRRGTITRPVLLRFFKEFSIGLDLTDRQLERSLAHYVRSNDATKEVNEAEFAELVLRMSQW